MSSDEFDDALLEDDIPTLPLGHERGVSDVLGVILLISLIVTVAAVVVGMGGHALQATQGDAEIQQAENAFAELDARASAVALGEGPSQRSISLGLNNQQQTELHTTRDANIKIMGCELENEDECRADYDEFEVLLDEELGSLVYTHGSTEIAYQSGGIWKHHGDAGVTEVLSPPSVDYDDATLTMPLVNVANDEQQLGTDDLTFTQGDSEIPEGTSQTVDSELVMIVVESEYYDGWGHYFENNIEGSVDTCYYYEDGDGECNENGELDENQVAIELGLSGDIHGSFDSAIVAGGDVYTEGDGLISGPVVSSGDIDGNVDGETYDNVDMNLMTLDAHIEELMREAEENYQHTGTIDGETEFELMDEDKTITADDGTTVLGAGRYYVDEIDLSSDEELILDVSDGEITMLVDGDTDLTNDSQIHVTDEPEMPSEAYGPKGTDTDDEQQARLLTNHDFTLGSGQPEVTTHDGPEDFQLYGGSSTDILISQDSTFEGVIYAPSDDSSRSGGNVRSGGANCNNTDYDVCIGANTSVFGSVVGGSTMVGESANLDYDDTLSEFEPTVSPDDNIRPRLLHLHVSVNDVHIGVE